MKKKHVDWWKVSAFCICTILVLGGLCIMVNQGMAKSKSVSHKEAFALYTKKMPWLSRLGSRSRETGPYTG
jgi:hypothetical protein